MSWSAEVVSSDQKSVQLSFKESVSGETFANNYPIPMGAASTWLADLVAAVIDELTLRQAVASAIPAPGNTVTPTAAPVAASDPDANTKSAFSSEWLQLKQMQVAINHGLKTVSDLDYVTLLDQVKKDFAANQKMLLPFMQEGT